MWDKEIVMVKKEMNELMDYVFEEVTRIRNAGQSEYARDLQNVFANFERVASFVGSSREKVLLTYMIKHVDGLCAYADGHKSQREDVRGRLTDAMVYLSILWGMIETEQVKYPGKSKYYYNRLKGEISNGIRKTRKCLSEHK